MNQTEAYIMNRYTLFRSNCIRNSLILCVSIYTTPFPTHRLMSNGTSWWFTYQLNIILTSKLSAYRQTQTETELSRALASGLWRSIPWALPLFDNLRLLYVFLKAISLTSEIMNLFSRHQASSFVNCNCTTSTDLSETITRSLYMQIHYFWPLDQTHFGSRRQSWIYCIDHYVDENNDDHGRDMDIKEIKASE